MDSEKIQELALGVALGTAEAEDRQELLRIQKQHPVEVARELSRAYEMVASLALTLPEQAPPEALKRRLMRNVQSIEAAVAPASASVRPLPASPAKRSFSPRAARVLAWAAVFLIVILGYGNFSIREQAGRLSREVRELQAQLDERQTTVLQLQSQLAQQQRLIQVMNAPRLQLVELQSTRTGAEIRGRVLLDHGAARAVFLAENLPALAADKDYELWYIAAGAPVPAEVFQAGSNGRVGFEISGLPATLHGIHTFAVTIEQKGGVAVPTLDQMVLAGKVSA